MSGFQYDNLDRIVQIQYNDGSSITYVYDRNGNLQTVMDNTGRTSFTYDNDNRIQTKTLPSAEVLTTAYDPVGNLTSYTDSGGKVSYTYRANNQIQTITDPDGAQTSFTYQGTQRQTMTYPNNSVVLTYGYDHANHITSEVAKNSGGTTLINMQYSYQIPGTQSYSNLLQTMTFLDPIYPQNGSYQWGYTYDSMSRLKEATLTALQTHLQVDDLQYQYDHAGNRTLYTESDTNANVSYSYNAADELTTKTPQGGQPSPTPMMATATWPASPMGRTTPTTRRIRRRLLAAPHSAIPERHRPNACRRPTAAATSASSTVA